MNIALREVASFNFLVIFFVVVGGFVFLKIVKKRLED